MTTNTAENLEALPAPNKSMTVSDVVEYENSIRDHNMSLKSSDPLHYAIAQEEAGAGVGGGWDTEVKAFVDASTLKHLFFSEDWVFIVVDIVAMKISSQPLRVMRGTVEENGEFTKEPAEGHELQNLIDQPNPYQSYEAWMYSTIVDLVLIGNAIEWYAPSANILMTLPAETISLDIDEDGKLEQYTMTEISTESGIIVAQRQTHFDTKEISHLRRPNPSSMLWGLSPFVPGRKSVLFNRYSTDYLLAFYQKGAMPGLALEMDKEANEKVALRLLRSFENAYTGRRNMRRTLVMPKGVSVKDVSTTLADQELSIYIDKNRETIINLLKVPKHELSLADSGSLGSEEYKTALKNFWHATLIPTMKIVAGELTKFFRSKGVLEGNEFLEFDVTGVEALQEDMSAKADLAIKYLNSGWSVNEVRTEVWKKSRHEDPEADRPFIIKPAAPAFGMGFGTTAPSTSAVQPVALPPLTASESGEASTEAEESKVVIGDASKASKESVASFLKTNDQWFDRREAKIHADAAKGVSAMESGSLRLFADMAATVIKTTRGFLKAKGWDEYLATKAEGDSSDDDDSPQAQVVKKNELRRRLRKALDNFEERWIDMSRTALSARVETGYGSALELPFNFPSETEINALRARGQAARQDALEERSGRIFGYLNETTIAQVFDVIERGIDKGKTVQAISQDLRDKFSNVEEIGARAMTIARTETLTAVSIGQAAAMKDAAQVVPNLRKMWISANDARVRDTHADLHGDVVKHDAAFKNGLMFPRDPSGSAGEVINCRCTWIMVPEEQLSDIDAGLAANEGE